MVEDSGFESADHFADLSDLRNQGYFNTLRLTFFSFLLFQVAADTVSALSLFHDECLLETAAKINPLVQGGGHTLLSRDTLFGDGFLLGVNILLLHILTLIPDPSKISCTSSCSSGRKEARMSFSVAFVILVLQD
jgi:hypothetical protein